MHSSIATAELRHELEAVVGSGSVGEPNLAALHDATESQGMRGAAEAVVRPADAEGVAAAVRWCYEHDVAITPRGGGTGFSGGAVPAGGVVLDLGRLDRFRSLEPALWRAEVEAGVRTATLRRRARESGLYFPPDPGAAEQSQVGGNIATNAGGPHAFKYGVTGNWVTGLEAVVAPGELISVGGPLRKDVAGYDLKSLLIGSEGTLGIVTSAWLRLIPAPAVALPVVGMFASVAAGCAAIEALLADGLDLAAIEYLDRVAVELTGAAGPWGEAEPAFVVIAEVDGSEEVANAARAELLEIWKGAAHNVHAPTDPAQVRDLWRWRDGVSLAVQARLGGKISEDIVVPLDRLAEAIEGTTAIGDSHGLPTCSWGHAGDGNLHSTFLIDPTSADDIERATAAAHELFGLAISLGGSISGEHGLGTVKSGQLRHQWPEAAVRLHRELKQTFDPKGLFNPGKKLA